jgi:hypothetical protein
MRSSDRPRGDRREWLLGSRLGEDDDVCAEAEGECTRERSGAEEGSFDTRGLELPSPASTAGRGTEPLDVVESFFASRAPDPHATKKAERRVQRLTVAVPKSGLRCGS